jgi:hypothetical protein
MTMKRGTRVILTALCPRCPGEIGKVSSRKPNGWLRVSLTILDRNGKRLTVSVRNIAGQVCLFHPSPPPTPPPSPHQAAHGSDLDEEQRKWAGPVRQEGAWFDQPRRTRSELIREREVAYECVKELEREVNFLNGRLALATNIIKEYHESGVHDVEGVEDFIN